MNKIQTNRNVNLNAMNEQLGSWIVRRAGVSGLFVAMLLLCNFVQGQNLPPTVPPLTPEYPDSSNTTVQTLPEPTALGTATSESTMPEPSIPTTLPEPTQNLPVLPDSTVGNVSYTPDTSNCRPSSVATANPNFQANYTKAFVGHPSAGAWPPTYGTSTVPVVATTPTSDVSNMPVQPVVPQTAPVNGAVSQGADMSVIPVDSSSYPTTNGSESQVTPETSNIPAVPLATQVPDQPATDEVAVRTIHAQTGANTANISQIPQAPVQQAPLNQVPVQPMVPQQPVQQQVPQQAQLPAQQPVQQQIPQQAQLPAQQPVQQQVPQQAQLPAQQPVQQANQSPYLFTGGSICALKIRACQPGEHPMAPLVPWAKSGLEEFASKIQDYSCIMTKRERINGRLNDTNSLFMKVREKPYSVYVYYLTPSSKKGVEALYRKGYHNDQLLGHEVGMKAMFGAVWLDPKGRMAMMGQKYPITDAGIPNLVRKMLETVTMDLKNDPQGKNTTVKIIENGGKIDGRPCIRIDVAHPQYNSCYRFHLAEIYLDREWGVPVRYAAWLWPEQQGGKPILDEEFTMTKIKFNQGMTDKDFSETNPEYNFQKRR